jgi:1,2-diacylglycerol 3-alpha-glucosyltransferase
MKILHLCLASFYIDNYSYQENLLPKFHKKMGLDVEIIASLVSFDKNGNPSLLKIGSEYKNEYGIPVKRLNYKKGILNRIFRVYENTLISIWDSDPDIIFIHGCQFLDILSVKKFVLRNPGVRVFVDNHADFSNSARRFFSRFFLHSIVWRFCAKEIEPFTEKFYGVLPARVDFLKNVYKVNANKIELLVMGADDDAINEMLMFKSRFEIRKKMGINDSDFLIVTGGKIDNAKKQVFELVDAVRKLNRNNVKLIIFGSVIDELKEKLAMQVDGDIIQYVGWANISESYEYLYSADLVVFPGRHSVYWEQTVGIGVPMLVKYWPGTTHVNTSGNCVFLYDSDSIEIQSKILHYIDNPEEFCILKYNAQNESRIQFLYSDIARRSININ